MLNIELTEEGRSTNLIFEENESFIISFRQIPEESVRRHTVRIRIGEVPNNVYDLFVNLAQLFQHLEGSSLHCDEEPNDILTIEADFGITINYQTLAPHQMAGPDGVDIIFTPGKQHLPGQCNFKLPGMDEESFYAKLAEALSEICDLNADYEISRT